MRDAGVEMRGRGGATYSRPPVTDGERAAIVGQYAAGATIAEVPQKTGRATSTVRKVLVEAGGDLRFKGHGGWRGVRPSGRRPTPVSDQDRADIAAQYAAGEAMNTIARGRGMSYFVVRRVLRDAGVELRQSGPVRKRTHGSVAMYNHDHRNKQ